MTIVLAVGAGVFYWYHTSSAPPAAPPAAAPQASEFERVYNQLGIQPLPSNVERRQQVQRRLDQLSREACYTDAIVGLGRALLDAGYPREAAIGSRSFVKRCGSASEVLPLAYTALQKINDYSGALEVANELGRVDKLNPDADGGKQHECGEALGQFVVAGGDPT
jgi:hypothetical protein